MSPTMRKCVDAFCIRCKVGDLWAIGNCEQVECPLHPVRPNKSLFGKFKEDFDEEVFEQQVEDNLNLNSLRRTIGE